ncbi:MAG: DUF4149 domain-containing protein [Phycisphaerales bacterium]|nr:DUF4149 domain-containing protein [Phycisphaerales bacterium]
MKTALAIVISLVWALWFGGLMTIFISVQSLFNHSRDLAVQANPVLFASFERYQLILAAIALLSTFAWILSHPSRWKSVLFILFALAALGAVISSAWITPRINELQAQHLTATPEFRKAHGQSMMIYTATAALLLIAGLILPLLNRPCRANPPAQTDHPR